MKSQLDEILNKNLIIIKRIDKFLQAVRTQNYDKALRTAAVILKDMEGLVNDFIQHQILFQNLGYPVDLESMTSMFMELLKAQESGDYILLADLYEIQLYPFLTGIQEILSLEKNGIPEFELDRYNKNYEIVKERYPELANLLRRARAPQRLLCMGYHIEYTSCGAITLNVQQNGVTRYFHSNINPYKEASILANFWYEETTCEYTILGLGLGYHIMALAELDDTIHLNVYESDISIFQLAVAFMDLKQMLDNPCITLHYDPGYQKLYQHFYAKRTEEKLLIHYPSLIKMEDSPIKEKLENYFLQYSALKNQIRLLNGNFRKNINYPAKNIDLLIKAWKGKTIYIIAAGPSLDKNYNELKKRSEDSILLAVGTVYKKLLEADIIPDFVIFTEATRRSMWHIREVDTSKVPILYLTTTYYRLVERYQGEHYLICQKDFERSEAFAEQHGYHTYRTGGSVSTTALELAIRGNCKRIVFAGLDLAYSGDARHAENTSGRKVVVTSDMKKTQDIYGEEVYTGKNLIMFQNWIENRIKETDGIEFIDATEGGVRIKGTKLKKLREVVQENH